MILPTAELILQVNFRRSSPPEGYQRAGLTGMRRAARGQRTGRIVGRFDEAEGNLAPSLAMLLAHFNLG